MVYLLPFVFAILFWASFHPLNLGFLGWVALVPLLVYARATSGRKAFFVAWLGGWLAFAGAFFWVRYTVPVGPYFLAAYKGLYVAVFVAVVRRLGPAWAPVAWTGLEYLRGTLFGGLPWFALGYTQHEAGLLIQVADLGGVWLVTALVALVNGALVDGRRAWRLAAGAAVALAWVYGAVRAGTLEMREGPVVAVIQPNIPQDVKKLMLRRDERQRIYEKHRQLTDQAAMERPDLIVWPEAALYDGLVWDRSRGAWHEDYWHERVTSVASSSRTRVLIGLLVREPERIEGRIAGDQDEYTNSAIYLDASGRITGRYDKAHLVPFSEFVPFARTFPWMRELIRKFSGLTLSDMRAGKGFPVWDLGGERFGAQICYEGIFPGISREIARKGGTFTVNISNDGWFRDSAELDQMLAMSRFRAIESRIGFIRGTNTGISAFIDPAGRVREMIPGKEEEGILIGRVKLTSSGSLFRWWGGWAGPLAALGLAFGVGRRFFVDRKRTRA